jgi:ribosomal protein S18 acetylase RimI-like enzyme
MALGVDPAHRRRGHGRALVGRGIERADAGNVPIYLETETGPNVTFYETLGFDVLDEMVINAYRLPFTLMIHRPESYRPTQVDANGRP